MVSIIAPPEIFSAYAFAEDDSDPYLRWGTHLRIYAGLGASFPLTPFLVLKLNSRSSEPRRLHVTDRDGNVLPEAEADLGAHGLFEIMLLLGDSDTQRTVRLDVDGQSASLDGAALLDQRGRVIATRDRPPWMFAAPILHKLRVRGSAGNVFLRTRSVDVSEILEMERVDPVSALGLPVQGSYHWYVGFHDRDAALRRVKDGAPKRLNPMDRPFGPFDDISHADEVNRVEAMLATMQFGDGLESLVLRLVTDHQAAPWSQREVTELPVTTGARQFANAYRLGTMQMAASDPGLARFLGFSQRIDDFPDLSGRGWDTLAVVGLFAISPREFLRYGVDLVSLLHEPARGSAMLLDRLVQGLEILSGRPLRSTINEMIDRMRNQGLAVTPFVAFAAPVPAWSPPTLSKPEIIQTRWQGTRGDAPSMLFRSSFAFSRMPLASLSALARREGGQWVSRHEMLQVSPSAPTQRAKPGLFGHELEPNTRLNELNPNVKVQEPAGLISDQDIPADAGEVSFSVRASEFFGRFGSETMFGITPPARPKPPPPILRFHIKREEIDPTSDAALSPGTLKLTIAIPENWPEERFTAQQERMLGSAIVVPRLDDLAPGALALATLKLGLDCPSIPVDLTAPGFTSVDIPLPALGPQKSKEVILTGRFVDTEGNKSEIASIPITIVDVRPPKTYPTGIGLYWTSAPSASSTVELKLRWTAAPNSRHRVYLTDQAGLGLTDAELDTLSPDAEPSRGLVAALGCNKVIGGSAGRKDAFRLLTDPPIVANDTGEVVFTTTFPRSLATVQFLRVVPLGPDGAEPSFEKCGIVPVAVPESRRPPAPKIEGGVDPATGHATLTVSTEEFDRSVLVRDEPGLFRPGDPGAEAPQAVVRRAVSAVPDPIYARAVASGALTLVESATGRFSATFVDTNDGRGLEPFVRYVYWAQVRLPPERRLPANFVALEPAGGISPVDAGARQSHRRPTSLPSAPRILMYTPTSPPAAPDPANITISREQAAGGAVSILINVNNAPTAHASAVDQYRLAVWVSWPDRPIEPITNANGAALNGAWPLMHGGIVTSVIELPPGVDPTAALTAKLAFVDPLGRMSELLTLTAS